VRAFSRTFGTNITRAELGAEAAGFEPLNPILSDHSIIALAANQ